MGIKVVIKTVFKEAFFLCICSYYTEHFCILVEGVWLSCEAQAEVLEKVQCLLKMQLKSRNPTELLSSPILVQCHIYLLYSSRGTGQSRFKGMRSISQLSVHFSILIFCSSFYYVFTSHHLFHLYPATALTRNVRSTL